jgi:uncharacterized protein (DUF427 family)
MAYRIEPTPKWIRGMLGGSTVVDSRAVQLVWEIRYFPQYYVPTSDVADGLLTEVDEDPSVVLGPRTPTPPWGEPIVWQVGGGPGRALGWPDHEALGDHVRFTWDALDHWFEEDEEVYVHPRSPYTRIDAIPSSRHVQVEVDGTLVADTRRPVMLFETGLPPRTYIPKTDVRMDVLTPTDSETACPYKGTASYWSVTVDGTTHDDLVWSYATPLPESVRIAGLMAFYDEQVDVIVDGVRIERPTSPFG